jgi:hypothetical protein
MCSSEEFGQEHAHLLAVRAPRAVAGDTPDMGTSRADYEEVSKAQLIEGLRSPAPALVYVPGMAMVIKTVSYSPEAIAAAAWWVWIMNEQPLTAVPSTYFGVSPR